MSNCTLFMASKRLILSRFNGVLMEQALGFSGLLFGIGLTGAMIWLQNRPKTDFQVSMVPHTPLMFAGALIAILSVAYLLSVFGIDLPERPSRF